MRPNQTKHKLLAGQPALGAFLGFHAPAVVEALGVAGFDFVVLDAEHGALTLEQCEHMVRAAECTGLTPLVRVHAAARAGIGQYLDLGATGVQAPLVDDAGDARAVVEAAKFPDRGRRGLGGSRAGMLGRSGSLPEYVTAANEQTLVVVQIETARAIDHLDEILAVADVDAIFIGPSDLSTSLGHPGDTESPRFKAAVETIRRATLAAGKALGTVAPSPEAVGRLVDEGYTYFVGSVGGLLQATLRSYVAGVRDGIQVGAEPPASPGTARPGRPVAHRAPSAVPRLRLVN